MHNSCSFGYLPQISSCRYNFKSFRYTQENDCGKRDLDPTNFGGLLFKKVLNPAFYPWISEPLDFDYFFAPTCFRRNGVNF